MDKIINSIDTHFCKNYDKRYSIVIDKFNITVLLENIKNAADLYDIIRMHPDLTEDILVNIIKKYRHDIYLHECWLITQDFCEKYKDEFTLSVFEMISNCLPVKYIFDTYSGSYSFTDLDIYEISKYCTESEYDKYCKSFKKVCPYLENPNMTVEWYISGHGLNNINWSGCFVMRGDLFTPDVIMNYKDHISNSNDIWKYCFNRLPGKFITQNIMISYCDVYYCVDTFREHPDCIGWYVIDKYIRMHTRGIKRPLLHIPNTINNMPCWFVKKYIDMFRLTYHHTNTHVNYKFIVKHIGVKAIDNIKDIVKIRDKYIEMLSTINNIISDGIGTHIDSDLHATILKYC